MVKTIKLGIKKNPLPQKEEMRKRVVACFQKDPETSMTLTEVVKRLGYKTTTKIEKVGSIFKELESCGVIEKVKTGYYKLNKSNSILEGTLERKSHGHLYMDIEGFDFPIFISAKNSKHALEGDEVRIQIFKRRKNGDAEGEVIEILSRSKKKRVGVIQLYNGKIMVNTGEKYSFLRVRIPHSSLMGATPGDKVTFVVEDWEENEEYPSGKIIDIIGRSGDNTTEMHAILAEFGLPYSYPEEPVREAENIPDDLSEEIPKREDFRNVLTFTIDPKDAKDFDDALSVRSIQEGIWEIGVHIADVTHYVRTNSLIDREAFDRATSIYLVDRTIPMLPERLSNFLCSLRPMEDKLCFSVIFEMNEEADVLKSRIVRSVINSNRRFNYGEVQKIIENGEGEYTQEILLLNQLAQKLRKERFKNGAISFEGYEVKFNLDSKGKPVGVYFKSPQDANHLIEEFMLLANRKVAETIGKVKNTKPKTFVYRVHEQPQSEKLENFSNFVKKLGYQLNITGKKEDVAKSINKLLDDVSGKRESSIIENICLRAMCKAIYSTLNIGHYGLAFDYYTHFTSPIRRYPDMMVHRLLERYLNGETSVSTEKYEEFCDHCSEMEQLSVVAERASIKYKQVEFMMDKLGNEYDATISGVTEGFLFVEINENKCEGKLSVSELEDDKYEYDKENYRLVGIYNHKIYRLGDPIKIRVVGANLERRQLDFILADKKVSPTRSKHKLRF
ncbi:MAG TPA: ribonuclease R [Porphyromonadaceae bacterium]|nr:ribonuclease R [Porphyromonadaceae bacterium]